MAKIFIDPGHGGKDPGAVNSITTEKVINLSIALKLKALLVQNGFDVMCSREDDTFIDLTPRCDMANNWRADLFISIHHDAGGGIGYNVIYSINGGKGEAFANIVAEEFQAIGQVPHGSGTYSKPSNVNPGKDYYAVIRQTNMPAVISEFAFMDTDDFYKIATDEQQMQEVVALAKAFCKYFGVIFEQQPVLQADDEFNGYIAVLKQNGIIDSDHASNEPATWFALAKVAAKVIELLQKK